MNAYVALGSSVVGLLVGLTGTGGGALMTPMLVLVFSVKPSAAISSDLVATLFMRPVGAAVHFRRGTVDLRLVAWLSAGSVPAALAGALLLRQLGQSRHAVADIDMALGAALLLGAGAMALRVLLDGRSPAGRSGSLKDLAARPLPTVVVGAVGGLVVGATSVGAGSLMIVLLLFVYPTIAAKQLVGTDLAQAIPLTAAATVGALWFGHVEVPVAASIVVGAVPGVVAGSVLSSRVSDRLLRPAIVAAILASGLEYVRAGEAAALAGAALGAAGFAVAGGWRPLRRRGCGDVAEQMTALRAGGSR